MLKESGQRYYIRDCLFFLFPFTKQNQTNSFAVINSSQKITFFSSRISALNVKATSNINGHKTLISVTKFTIGLFPKKSMINTTFL